MPPERLCRASVLVALLASVTGSPAYSVTATLSWNVSFGRTVGGEATYEASAVDAAGNTYVLENESGGRRIVKFDAGGTLVQWAIVTGVNSAGGMAVDGGGNVYIAGASSGSVWVAKYGPVGGAPLWQTTHGTGAGFSDSGLACALDGSGDLLVAGYRYNTSTFSRDALIEKFSSTGVFQWADVADWGTADAAYAITSDGSGNVFATGRAGVCCPSLPFVRKYSPGGSLTWSRTYMHGTGLYEENGRDLVHRAADDSVYVTSDGENSTAVWVFKASAVTGDEFGLGTYLPPIRAKAGGVAVDATGNCWVTGWDQNGTTSDLFLVGFNAVLTLSASAYFDSGWSDAGNRTLESSSYGADARIRRDGSGNLYVTASASLKGPCGWTRAASVILRKYTPACSLTWGRLYAPLPPEEVAATAGDGSGGLYIAGGSWGSPMLLRYDGTGGQTWGAFPDDPDYFLYSYEAVAHVPGVTWTAASGPSCPSFSYDIVIDAVDDAGNYFSRFTYTAAGYPRADAIALDGSGNLLIAGTVQSDTSYNHAVLLVKADPAGAVYWSRTISPFIDNSVYSVAVDGAGAAYVLDNPSGSGSTNGFTVIKYDAAGNWQWTKTYTGGLSATWGETIRASGSSVWFCGFEDNGGLVFSGVLYKLDVNGNVIWRRVYSGADDAAYLGLAVDGSDNTFVAGGAGNMATYTFDHLVNSYDSAGALRWTHIHDEGQPDEFGGHVVTGSVLVAGSGNDNGTSDVHLFKLTESAGPTANLVTAVGITPDPAIPGQWVRVILTVTNTGTANATGVTATIWKTSGGSLVTPIGGVSPAGPVTLAANGGAQKFTWTYSAAGSGTVGFTMTVSGTNAGTGGAIAISAARSLTIADVAVLGAAISLSPSTTVWTGQMLTVALTVSNTGAASASNVMPGIQINGGGAALLALTGPLPSGPATLAAGTSTTFVWTYSATGSANVSFTVTGAGTDAIFGPIAASATGGPGLLRRPAALTSILTVAPSTASVGQVVTCVQSLMNLGQADATGVSATIWFGPVLALRSSPTGAGMLAAGGTMSFTWTFTATGAGTTGFTATATGTDAALGVSLTTTPSGSVSIQTPAALNASVAAWPGSLRQGQLITVTLWVENSGQAPAALFTPAAGASPVPSSRVASLSGPSPAGPVPIPGGASAGFTWTYEALTSGPVVFIPYAAGVDGNAGWTVTAGGVVPWSVTVTSAALLKAVVVVSPASVKVGESFNIQLTVSNIGDNPATATGGSLTLGNSAAAEVMAIPASGQTIAPGGSIVQTWTLVARTAGSLAVTASVTGQDGAYAVGAVAQATVVLAPRFEEEVVVYPNPADGDRLTIGLKLKDDAAEVTVEVYTVSYRKVWSGRWTSVGEADGTVEVDGVLGWAPGPYWLRAAAVLADGSTQQFPVAKVVVRR